MASFTLGEILKAVSGVLLQQGSHEYCTGVNTDTRTISPGELFIALQGNTFDGHHFLNDACINGASMVIISERSSFKAVPRRFVYFISAGSISAIHYRRLSLYPEQGSSAGYSASRLLRDGGKYGLRKHRKPFPFLH